MLATKRFECETRTRVYLAIFAIAIIVLIAFLTVRAKRHHEDRFDTAKVQVNYDFASQDFPKVVHQIWLNYKNSPEPPADWLAASEATKKLNPDYEFQIWRDEHIRQLFQEYFPWFLETFNRYEYNIERVDAAKYFIMQKHGGVYLDWDEIGHISFDEVIERHNLQKMECMMPAGTPNGITNYVMMCKKETPFFSYMTSRMRYYHGWYGIPYATVMWSTGPRFVSARYSEYENKESIYILPSETVKKYFECLFGQSWFSWDGYIIHAVAYPFVRMGVPWIYIGVFPLCIVGFVILYIYCSRLRRRALAHAEQRKV